MPNYKTLNVFYTSLQIKKRGLCAYDDKRYLLADGISTLAFGHKAIPATVRAVQETRGTEQIVLTSAEAYGRQMPLFKRRIALGQDPAVFLNEARRAAEATLRPPPTPVANRPLNVIYQDPDGPNALTQDQLIDFIFGDDEY